MTVNVAKCKIYVDPVCRLCRCIRFGFKFDRLMSIRHYSVWWFKCKLNPTILASIEHCVCVVCTLLCISDATTDSKINNSINAIRFKLKCIIVVMVCLCLSVKFTKEKWNAAHKLNDMYWMFRNDIERWGYKTNACEKERNGGVIAEQTKQITSFSLLLLLWR